MKWKRSEGKGRKNVGGKEGKGKTEEGQSEAIWV
jgi:hypothetical protein